MLYFLNFINKQGYTREKSLFRKYILTYLVKKACSSENICRENANDETNINN
jgi:hypothetical protein